MRTGLRDVNPNCQHAFNTHSITTRTFARNEMRHCERATNRQFAIQTNKRFDPIANCAQINWVHKAHFLWPLQTTIELY